MEDTLLSINDLRVEYTTGGEVVKAVNGIDFSILRGHTLGLVGETGAGKTTTALSILKLLPNRTGHIRAGSISFDGVDIINADEDAMRRIRGGRISMIFQDPMTALNPIMTVGEQIEECLLLHNKDKLGRAEIAAAVDRSLEMVGIPAIRKHEYPHQFSGGMKQRVVISMAICCNPELLIADEPTTALDVTIQAQILAIIKNLIKNMNSSMMMITHDLGIVAQTCDHVAVMYAGEIIEYGPLEDIFSAAASHHPYTVGLFGSLPNIEEDTARLSPIPGLMPDPTDLPAGCPFAPRCNRAMGVCEREKPAKRNISKDHSVKCHLFQNGESI